MGRDSLGFAAEWREAKDGTGELDGYMSVFGNVDDGGDVVVPGAFKRTFEHWSKAQAPMPLLADHDYTTDGLIGSVRSAREDATGARVRAVFSSTARAQDARTKMIEGHLRGMSFTYDPVRWSRGQRDGKTVRFLQELKVYEATVTPFPMNTLALASAKTAVKPHSTATDTGTWDGPAQVARLKEGQERSWVKAFAWYDAQAADPNGDGFPDAKNAYKFIHHFVAADGSVGAASTVACSAGIGVLNGGRGGTTIPAGDMAGVHAHLAAHLMDAGMKPPAMMGSSASIGWDDFADALRQALAIGHPPAVKAAVHVLLASYHPAGDEPGGEPEGQEPGTEPGPEPGPEPAADGDYASRIAAQAGGTAPEGYDPIRYAEDIAVRGGPAAKPPVSLDDLERDIRARMDRE